MTPGAASRFGQGVAFPPRLGPDARVAFSAGPENVRDAIRVILLTEPGERLMLPAFGAGLGRYLFEPNTTTTHRAIEEAVTRALQRWEPRIELGEVAVMPDPDDARAALVSIRYRLVANRAEGRTTVQVRLEG